MMPIFIPAAASHVSWRVIPALGTIATNDRARLHASGGRDSSRELQQAVTAHGFADDDALGPRDSRERGELRVAALDQLAEARRVEARRDCAARHGRRELAGVAVQGAALRLVVF